MGYRVIESHERANRIITVYNVRPLMSVLKNRQTSLQSTNACGICPRGSGISRRNGESFLNISKLKSRRTSTFGSKFEVF